MKLIIDIPEMAYEAFKEWHKNKVATVEQSIIANGTPYEERQHGEWEFDDLDNDYRCSKCHEFNDFITDFCPNCGADMRKEGEDK